jgi:sporulation protein YlmC with PRC-barrel domain
MAQHDRDRLVRNDDTASAGQLVHTRDLDKFEFPKDSPDPRGWDVRSADGTKVGKVEDLIVDTAERRVRYIEVALDRSLAKDTDRDYALVPIGQARLDDNGDNVVVDLASTDLAGAPRYDRKALSRDYETSLRSWLGQRRTAAGSQARSSVSSTPGSDRDVDFYSSPEYDDQRFFTRERGQRSGTAGRSTSSGVADRIVNAADDVKDRIDGNPASRPGPDPTDRR